MHRDHPSAGGEATAAFERLAAALAAGGAVTGRLFGMPLAYVNRA